MAFNISYIYHAIDRFTPTANRIARSTDRIKNKMNSASLSARKLDLSLSKIQKITLAGTGAAIVGATFAYAKYETALLGVAKTSNIEVGPKLNAVGREFVKLSRKIPVSAIELLNFGQSAAQLGVTGTSNILKFSETIAKLTKTTNIAGEEGATNLARLISITKGNMREVENFASVLVDLGNTTAVTESEILSFSTRLAGSAALFGITGTQAMGLAAVLKSLGVMAEEGSSSVGRGLGAINKAILKGGTKLTVLSQLTGIAAKDMKKAFGADAISVLTKFAIGLDNATKKGIDASQALAFFGLEGIRDLKTMGLLAKNSQLVADKMDQASVAFAKNIALQKEFSIQSKSLANKWQMLKNTVFETALLFGSALAPILDGLLWALNNIFDSINAVIKSFNKVATITLSPVVKAWRGTVNIGNEAVDFWKKKFLDQSTSNVNTMYGPQQPTLQGSILIEAAKGTNILQSQFSQKNSNISLGTNMPAGAQ